jgi:antitoxin (DNA-binding transcriptional repressor) of toxin-antitoxin stability system
LIEKAEKGEPFIIARAGKPVVKVTAIEEPDTSRRLGFMKDVHMVIPEDFDRWAEDEIAEMFGVKP